MSHLFQPNLPIIFTCSDMVAEKSMVCLVWEHNLITSFICSAKYSSNILHSKIKEKSNSLQQEYLGCIYTETFPETNMLIWPAK